MRGTETRLILQPRDFSLLAALVLMVVADRELLRTAAGFHSTTRINTRLASLVHAGLIKRLKLALSGRSALYTITRHGFQLLTSSGRMDVESYRPLSGTAFLEHQLEINRVYVAAKYQPIPLGLTFRGWQSFHQPFSVSSALIPDGYFEIELESRLYPMFLEVDLGTEGLRDWKDKAQKYLRFAVSGEFEQQFRRSQFRVLVLANSETRLHAIRRTVRNYTEKVFWFSTLNDIHRDGLWSPVWLRPSSEQRQALLGTA